jgi:putative membrane protein
MNHRSARRLPLLFVLVVLLAACGTTSSTMMQTIPGAMPDADVAGIVTAANEGEVQQGSAASSRATSGDVRSFAQMMVADHTAALNTARDMLSRNNTTPAENETSRGLRDNSQRTITNLATYSGAAFDREYMQTQVNLHQWLLTTLDTVLIPSARNADMKALLITQRGSVAAHLERARSIRAGL